MTGESAGADAVFCAWGKLDGAAFALHEIGAPFESRPLSFHRKENRDPAFLAINPEGKVPTLLLDDRPLTEVAGILFYLARRFPQAGLLPTGDVESEARVVSWMSFIAATVHPARRQALEHARRVYAVADQRLGEQDWAVGRYSIADIHLFRLFGGSAACSVRSPTSSRISLRIMSA